MIVLWQKSTQNAVFTEYSFLNNYVDYIVSGSVTDVNATQSLVIMTVTDDDVPGGDGSHH